MLGAVLLVGAIGIVDLRLVGALRTLPTAALVKALSPFGVAGFVLMLASGSVLFAADAAALAGSAIFRWKLVLVALALANAMLFRVLWARTDGKPGPVLRLMALASLLSWLAVLVLGRWIAYG